jgi:hypothetical protein
MKVKSLFVILIAILIGQNLFSQKFSQTELKQIDRGIDSLILAYEKYASLTHDYEHISQRYIEALKGMFDEGASQTYVFNDLEKREKGKKSLEAEKITLSTYISRAKNWYKEGGLGVRITEIYPDYPPSRVGNKYEIKVNLSKRISGFFKDEVEYEAEYPLVFTITFNKRGSDYMGFKIKGINSPEQEKVSRDLNKNFELGLTVSPLFVTSFSSDLFNDIEAGSGIQVSVDLINYYYFMDKFGNNKIGGGIGIGFSSFSSNLKLEQFNNPEFETEDIDQDKYFLRSDLHAIDNDIKLNFIDINLHMIKFKNSNWIKSLNLYADLIVNVSVPLNTKQTITGFVSDTGFYPEYNCELYEIPVYGFESDKEFEYKPEVKFNPIILSGTFTAGINKNIFKDVDINLGFFYRHGLVIVDTEYFTDCIAYRESGEIANNYNSLLGLIQDFKFSGLGMNASIIVKF